MKLIVEFFWNEKELGDGWFNIDNLSQCLFTEKFTRRELLKVKEKDNLLSLVEIDGVAKAVIIQYIDAEFSAAEDKWVNRVSEGIYNALKNANPIKLKETEEIREQDDKGNLLRRRENEKANKKMEDAIRTKDTDL